MKTIHLIIMSAMLAVACSTGDDDAAPFGEALNNTYTNGMGMNSEWNGEFAVNWTVNNEIIDSTRLQVQIQSNVLAMPFEWLHRQAFPAANEVTSWQVDNDGWDMRFSVMGYSESNVYFYITNPHYSHRAMVDGRLLTYDVYFSPERSTAVYNRQWDSWTAIMPIDSIEISDETMRQNHRPVVIETRRFAPALPLSLNSTNRTRNSSGD